MFVIVSGEAGTIRLQTVDLVTGPFETRDEAVEFRDLLEQTTSGRNTIVALHTPTKKDAG